MLKKLLFIGLVCLGVTAFMVSQASAGCCCNPRFCASWLRGSVEGQITVCDDIEFLTEDGGKEVIMRLFDGDGDGELPGTVICARDSIFNRIRERRIKICRNARIPECLKKWFCKAVPGVTIDYDNDDPLVASKTLEVDDCDEVCCTAFLEIDFEEDLFEGVCPPGYNFASFVPDADENPGPVFIEAIARGVPDIELCPDDNITRPDLLQAEECTGLSDGTYSCEKLTLEDLEDGVIPDYPGGYGGYGGVGEVDVCNGNGG